jgi:glyoxylase-like metal-dependent hydrolase (beta-lactamase superfamily II)/rhodanese-related sulfurtransferase
MHIQRFFTDGLAHISYLVGGESSCAIVDPRRDIDAYITAAKSLGLKITHVLETHLHADFISGHIDLADATGARIVVPRSAGCQFDHLAVGAGDVIEMEAVLLRVLDTPGHTPEHISYVAIDNNRGEEPAAVFCGDTLFVGDVGRPDLFPGRATELASLLFESLRQLMRLPDYCEVYPAHGAGSLCGRAISAKQSTTVGYERKYNPALQIDDKGVFVKEFTHNMPTPPDHFSRCSDTNRIGPVLGGSLPSPRPMGPEEFRQASQLEDAIILDVRSYDAYSGQHIPGALHIDHRGNFATFAGWIIPPDKDVLLVVDDDGQLKKAIRDLQRVGLDRIVGHLGGGMAAWVNTGLTIAQTDLIPANRLNDITKGEKEFMLVDVRTPTEYEDYHIDGAVNIEAPDLRERFEDLDLDIQTVVVCSTGIRASMAASVLERNGFGKLANVTGGMTGYATAGYSPECIVCRAPHGPK